MWPGVIRAYRRYLPLEEDRHIITLLEGNTPLIRAKRLERLFDSNIQIHLKYEGLNPTGSFKDRGMTVAISKAVEDGAEATICASTGNTAAAAAAYAARAGLRSYILIPKGKVALGKLSQAMIHGANVLQVEGSFDVALDLVRKIAEEFKDQVTLVNSVNPYRIEGQKTAAFEICDRLGSAPDYHALPVGNAGNITAYWKGYREYHRAGKIDKLPRMLGFQAEDAAPIVCGRSIEKPRTIATAIRIGNPASWKRAEAARDESGGLIDSVSDAEITTAYRQLADLEGVFCELASAASVAGLIKLDRANLLEDGATVVCTLTGHGLKDPESAIRFAPEPISVAATQKAILEAMGW
ncbi:MAG: threonine synthase [Candidatus Bipolaricaulia bacterium]